MCERYFGLQFGNFVLFFLLAFFVFAGCQSTQVTGKDPLLGKTRLDPPATSARSVYVERQNFDESGVVPGGRIAEGQKVPRSVKRGVAERETRTVRYHSPENGSESDFSIEKNKEANTEKAAGKNVSATRLKWKSAREGSREESPYGMKIAQNTESGSDGVYPREPGTNTGDYRYFYDFGTFPARRVPIGGTLGGRGEFWNDREERFVNGDDDFSGLANFEVVKKRESGTNENFLPKMKVVQLVPEAFDPYAPHREYERKRGEISRMMAADFDSPGFSTRKSETAGAPTENEISAYGGGNFDKSRNRSLDVADELKVNQLPRKDEKSGWEVVSTPVIREKDGSQYSFAAQMAIPAASVGGKVQISPKSRVDEKKQNPHRLDEDPVIELLDLPGR